MNAGIRVRIRQRRNALGLTQLQLAKMIGVTNNTVHFWEIGKVRPWETLAKLAASLGVTADWLLTGRDVPAPPQPRPMKVRKVTTLREVRAILERAGHSEVKVAAEERVQYGAAPKPPQQAQGPAAPLGASPRLLKSSKRKRQKQGRP